MFYVAVGQKESTVAGIVEVLRANGAMEYTTVVVASAADPAPLQYIAPYAGCTMAEYFMWKGEHTLCVYDDLTKQAAAYRQLSLLLRRPPGREAFPGDVFYLHSRLLERSVKLSDAHGGGSLTALPIIETQDGDVSAYIPTNVISTPTAKSTLSRNCSSPASARPLTSASASAESAAMPRRNDEEDRRLAQARPRAYRELEAFAQLGTDLDKATQRQLDRGARLVELLKQPQFKPMPVELETMAIYAGTQGHLDDIPVNKVQDFQNQFFKFIDDRFPALRKGLAEKK